MGHEKSVACANIPISRMKLALNPNSTMRASISSTVRGVPFRLSGLSSTSGTSRESQS
jgi:hypothetical protein